MGCHSGQNYVFTIIHNFGQHRCFTVQLMSRAVQLVSRTFKQNRKSDQHISDLVRLSPPPVEKSAAWLLPFLAEQYKWGAVKPVRRGRLHSRKGCIHRWNEAESCAVLSQGRSEAHYCTRFVLETEKFRTIWTSLVLCMLWAVCNRELASELAVVKLILSYHFQFLSPVSYVLQI